MKTAHPYKVDSGPGFYSVFAKMSLTVNANLYYTSRQPLVFINYPYKAGNFVGKVKTAKEYPSKFTSYTVFVNTICLIRWVNF